MLSIITIANIVKIFVTMILMYIYTASINYFIVMITKYIFQCISDTGVSIEWLLNEDKPTFHISGGSKNISQVNGGIINQGSVIEKEFELFDENDPVFISFKKAYECVKNEKNKLNELEDLLEDFYRKYR